MQTRQQTGRRKRGASRARGRHAGAAAPWAALLAATLATLALSSAALPEDSSQPIHLNADAAEGDISGRTVLTGSVRMDQGTMRVEADTMIIEHEGDKVIRITAMGDLAHYQQQLEADQALVNADAKTIIYHTVEERVELRGEALLTQNDNEFRGETIVYDIKAGKVDATSDENGGRVQVIWQPPPAEDGESRNPLLPRKADEEPSAAAVFHDDADAGSEPPVDAEP